MNKSLYLVLFCQNPFKEKGTLQLFWVVIRFKKSNFRLLNSFKTQSGGNLIYSITANLYSSLIKKIKRKKRKAWIFERLIVTFEWNSCEKTIGFTEVNQERYRKQRLLQDKKGIKEKSNTDRKQDCKTRFAFHFYYWNFLIRFRFPIELRFTLESLLLQALDYIKFPLFDNTRHNIWSLKDRI